ncbi:MAG TPA: helix-turn-helix domain-containing protein [Pyrinomonadaceae bacterium]
MKVKLYRPQNPSLAEYIECIYILSRSAEEPPARYLTFPIHFTLVTISEKSKFTRTEHSVIIEHCPRRSVESTLVCDFSSPLCVYYKGRIKEITIYFKPLGINAFLENDLDRYCESGICAFDPFEDFRSSMNAIFAIEEDDEKIRAMELYWLSKLREFEHPFLKKVVAEMMDENIAASTISETAFKTGVSRQTLNKHFERHVGKTASKFRKTLRFRNAMSKHPQMSGKKKLTEITHSLDYFDQAHMIKDFKSLTGHSPKAFFKKITEIEKGQINWLFL